jgi:hypothetical protein
LAQLFSMMEGPTETLKSPRIQTRSAPDFSLPDDPCCFLPPEPEGLSIPASHSFYAAEEEASDLRSVPRRVPYLLLGTTYPQNGIFLLAGGVNINGAPVPQRLATNTAAPGAFYPCKTCTRSLTASALSFRSPSSSSLRASSMMSSMPEAPSLTGTPTKRSSIPYSPCR